MTYTMENGMQPAHLLDDHRAARVGSSAFAALLRMLVAPAIGAAAGLLLLVTVVLPAVGLGDVQRIASLGRHLDQELRPRPAAVFLGNSITREGIDAAQVEAAATAAWHVENLALSGCGVLEARILTPKLLRARPDVVVLSFHPRDLGWIDDLPLDKSYAYAMGGFVEAWPAGWTRESLPGLGQASYDALRSSWLRQQFHFRTAPLNALNDAIRRMSRRNTLRAIQADNWSDPYEMTSSVSGARLQEHARATRREIQAVLREGIAEGASEIPRLVREIRAGGATPVLVVLPFHPLLREGYEPGFDIAHYLDALRSLLAETAARNKGLYVDASDLLAPNDYADVLHPNAQGRAKYSQFMGRQLRDLPATRR